MGTIFYAMFLSIPFYIVWNGLAPTYFYFLPPVYHRLAFLDCMGLFVLVTILRIVLIPRQEFKVQWKGRPWWSWISDYRRGRRPPDDFQPRQRNRPRDR